MTGSREETFSALYQVAEQAGNAVAAQHPDWITVEDATQEAMLWLLGHPNRVRNHTFPDGTLHVTRLAAEAGRAAAKVAAAAREAAEPPDPTVHYRYSERLVRLLIPGVWDTTYAPPALDASMRRRSITDPAEAGNWRVMVMDVKRAVEAVCSRDDKVALFLHLLLGWTQAEVGEYMGVSETTAGDRVRAAVRAIVKFLNAGVVPDRDVDGAAVADALHGSTSRPVPAVLRGVVSNAQAQAQTSSDYYGG